MTPWTATCQAPLSMEIFRQEYWSGLPFPSPGDLPHLGIEPGSPTLPADSLPSDLPGKPPSEQSVFPTLGKLLSVMREKFLVNKMYQTFAIPNLARIPFLCPLGTFFCPFLLEMALSCKGR